MKKTKGFIAIIFLAVITIFIFMLINIRYELSNDNKVDIFTDNSVSNHVDVIYPLENIDDLIMIAHYIVVGKAEKSEQHGVIHPNHLKYTFQVDKYLKGEEYSERIDVFQLNNDIEVGSEYVLFLDYSENVLFPNPKHATIADIKISGNSLIGDSRFIGNMNKEQMIDYISKSPLLTVTTKKDYNIVDIAKNDEELINSSDYIIHVKMLDVEIWNKNVSLAGPLIIERFKGGRLGMPRLPLPADIQAGEEYLLFLKDRNSSIGLTTRNGSIIEKNDEIKWEEMMSKLKEQ